MALQLLYTYVLRHLRGASIARILGKSMKPYPLIFDPILKEKVWGGRFLAQLGKSLPGEVAIGESWELADLPASIPQGRSVISNGPLAGQSLNEAIGQHEQQIMGAARLTGEGGFPLLIKFLDAREDLSVQVHPSAEYSRQHPQAHLKSEAWVVIAAEPGAKIYRGVKPDVTAEQFAAHIDSGTVAEDLIAIPAKIGDCHYLPSGTCHALGAGIVVAEIQTPSDTTFRVYDWGRTGRELHVAQALQCIQFGEPAEPSAEPPLPIEAAGMRTVPLLKTRHFVVEQIEAHTDAILPVVTSGLPVVWMILSGRARITTFAASADSTDVDLPIGTTALMPAALEDAVAQMAAQTSLLRITLPSPMEGLIA